MSWAPLAAGPLVASPTWDAGGEQAGERRHPRADEHRGRRVEEERGAGGRDHVDLVGAEPRAAQELHVRPEASAVAVDADVRAMPVRLLDQVGELRRLRGVHVDLEAQLVGEAPRHPKPGGGQRPRQHRRQHDPHAAARGVVVIPGEAPHAPLDVGQRLDVVGRVHLVGVAARQHVARAEVAGGGDGGFVQAVAARGRHRGVVHDAGRSGAQVVDHAQLDARPELVLVERGDEALLVREPLGERLVGAERAAERVVEVGVRVDESGNDRATAGVDALTLHPRGQRGGADGGDRRAFDDHAAVGDHAAGGVLRDDGAARDDRAGHQGAGRFSVRSIASAIQRDSVSRSCAPRCASADAGSPR